MEAHAIVHEFMKIRTSFSVLLLYDTALVTQVVVIYQKLKLNNFK